MSQTFFIIAIVGFSLAVVLALIGVVMYFTLHIRCVRDDLTGKTAARAIAETRAHAKKHKRTATQVAKKYGWEKEDFSTDNLDASFRAAVASEGIEDKVLTSLLDTEEDNRATSLLEVDAKEDSIVTSLLDVDTEEDNSATSLLKLEEDKTTVLADGKEDKSVLFGKSVTSKMAAVKSNAFVVFLLIVLLALPASYAWAEAKGEALDTGGALDTEEALDTEPETTDSALLPLDISTTSPSIGDSRLGNPVVCVPSKLTIMKGGITPYVPKYTGSNKTSDLRLWIRARDLNNSPRVMNVSSSDQSYLVSLNNTSFPAGGLTLSPTTSFPLTAYVKIKAEETLTLDHIKSYDPDTNVTEPITIAADEVVQLPRICVDADAPVISNVSISRSSNATELKDTNATNSPTTLYAEYITVAVTAADNKGNGKDENSGIDTFKITADKETYTVDPSSNGVYRARVDKNGSFKLEDIAIEIEDVAGNKTTTTLRSYYNNNGSANKPTYQTVSIDSAEPTLSIQGVLEGAAYTSSQDVTVTINDSLFAKNNATRPAVAANIVTVDFTNNNNGVTTSINPFIFKDYSNSTGDKVTWESPKYTCSQEGTYKITVSYQKLSGAKATNSVEFKVDKTRPQIGTVNVGVTTPVMWGWIFADTNVSLDAQVIDKSSGIDASSVRVIVDGVDQAYIFDPIQNTIFVNFPAMDQRIDWGKVEIEAFDIAGNKSRPCILNTHGSTNIPAGVSGIVLDAMDPVLTVSYDNDSAQNGTYYNKERVATITIVEATFDMVQTYDPKRVIVTKTYNGLDSYINAEDFELVVDGSGNQSWVATVPCSNDGEYSLNASFTDPSGKSAVPYSDQFTVDTTEPMISVSFDNEEANGGWYYKAPRTATVTVFDDNFSESLASVSTQASDASGAAVSAPGVSGWTQVAQGKWSTTVYFEQERHYAIRVACTDLAGNVGEGVEVPEFIIDMTAPTVTIERVENYTAYAGKVAPLITFHDENFQEYLCEVEIIAASKSENEPVYFRTTETSTDTSRVIDYEDFDYVLSNDDVYTINATIKDLAGNIAKESVTFSVNRFGSNYSFSDMTKPCIGSYLKESQDIVIVETNVSGLKSSSVSVAQNDTVKNLVANEDFEFVEDTQNGWAQYTYTLPAKLFEEDAYYRVMLASLDAAGNYNENLMHGKNSNRDDVFAVQFAVDSTSPTASLGNIKTNEIYFTPSQRVDVFMSDNLEAEKATLIVNSVRAAEWNAEDLAQGRSFMYDLPADEGSYTLKLEVVDKAGNVATTSVSDVVVTNDLVRYVLNTPAILYPLIAGVILTVGILIIIINRLVVRHKEKVKHRIALGV